ncbi:F0F1 ATP synthase subunit B [Streptomyces sp. H27-D2]|uniref:F0F1 ATP synthase subunit B n=1 Tax=Streptomyces sp. H27-D2 TaxID=3046304 RepID=UPI002DB6FBA3|nr:F0F1 ATP synthase subunit B [Streptomyces sp. H27-D2]MEC4020675.1 F0F1 ATP synthase subunit B [Streptomyces sp. H27-D2]
MDIGPLKPEPYDLIVGFICFFIVFSVLAGVLLPRIAKVIAAREDAIDGGFARAEELRATAHSEHEAYQTLMSDARHEAAHIRQQAAEQGTALLAEIRAEGQRQREEIVVTGQAVIAAERAVAEGELRDEVGALATELASRIVGEPLVDFVRDSGVVDRHLTELLAQESSDTGSSGDARR